MFSRVSSFVLLLTLLGGCAAQPTIAEGQSEQQEAAQIAKETEKEFSEGKEAKSWIAAADHAFFKVGKEPITKLTNDLYAAGAPEVRITLISVEKELGNKSFGGGIVVKMPKDAATRASVFKVVNAERQEMDDDPDKDTGQEYVSFGLD